MNSRLNIPAGLLHLDFSRNFLLARLHSRSSGSSAGNSASTSPNLPGDVAADTESGAGRSKRRTMDGTLFGDCEPLLLDGCLPLERDGSAGGAAPTVTEVRLLGPPKQSLSALWGACTADSGAPARVILGRFHDPVSSLPELFAILNFLDVAHNGQITVQTRSPLILLAAPLLRRMADRLTVCMHLESMDPTLSKRLSPLGGRPLERVEAVAALRRSGLPCSLRIAPLISESPTARDAVVALAWHAVRSRCELSIEAPRSLFLNGAGPGDRNERWYANAHHLLRREVAGLRSRAELYAA